MNNLFLFPLVCYLIFFGFLPKQSQRQEHHTQTTCFRSAVSLFNSLSAENFPAVFLHGLDPLVHFALVIIDYDLCLNHGIIPYPRSIWLNKPDRDIMAQKQKSQLLFGGS